jgi:hypothetical protein
LLNQSLESNNQTFTKENLTLDNEMKNASVIFLNDENTKQKKSGFLYKKAEGPVDFGWNKRYFVLDG